MGFSSGGVPPNNVDLTSNQTLQNKTIDNTNTFSGSVDDPFKLEVKQDTQLNLESYALTATDGQLCFATDVKQMYQIVDSTLAPVGGGGGGLDSFYIEDFEGAIGAADFATGNDVTFDNGGAFNGIFTNTTSSNISDSTSVIYTQASSSLNDFVKSPVIAVDKKQQGNTVGLTFYYTYSGDSDDIKVVGYDNTGSEVMTLASNLIKASTSAQRLSVEFPVPSDSTSISWGFQTVVENIGAALVVDDVEISTNPFVYKSQANITGWQDYTPIFTGFGAVTGSKLRYRQDGPDIIIQGEFQTGVVTATVATLTLPDSLVASIPYNGMVGRATINLSSSEYNDFTVLSLDADNTLGFGIINNSGIAPLTRNTGSGLFGSSQFVNLNARIPIQGWTAESEQVITYNSRNAENSMVRLHTGNGHGSTNTKIRRFSTLAQPIIGNAITYTDSATDGAEFLVNESGHFSMAYTDVHSVAADIGISLNSTQLTTSITTITAADRLTAGTTASASFYLPCSWSGDLKKGDVVRVHTGGTVSGANASFTISKIGVGDLMGVPVPRTCYIKDVKSSGAASGNFTSGAWRTRDLNTLEGDTEFISLNANQFTLQPGKYTIKGLGSSYLVNSNSVKIRDIDNNVDVLLGMAAHSWASDNTSYQSIVEGVIEITSTTTFELQHRCVTSRATNGFGLPVSFGVSEIFAQVKITKVSN